MESPATPKFCTRCGAQIRPDMKFCTGCGAEVPQAAAVPQPAQPAAYYAPPGPAQTQASAAPAFAAPSAGEHVLAAVGGLTLSAGFLGMKRTTYTLVATDRRIIFAETTADALKEAATQAKDAAKASGKGFFGQWGAQLSSTFGYAERYLSMSPEAAIAETQGNWVLDRGAIKKISLKHGMVGDENTGPTPDRVVIKTTGGKYDFQLTNGSLRSVKQALVQAGLV